MIRKSVQRFSLATNAKRLRGDHAQSKTLRISVIARLEERSPADFSAGLLAHFDADRLAQ
jgi:hypothetical protein